MGNDSQITRPLGRVWADYHFQASKSSILSESYFILDKILSAPKITPRDSEATSPLADGRINLYGPGNECWALTLPPCTTLTDCWPEAHSTDGKRTHRPIRSHIYMAKSRAFVDKWILIPIPVASLPGKSQFQHMGLSYTVHRKKINWNWNICLIICLNIVSNYLIE